MNRDDGRINSLTFIMSNWYQRGQNHLFENELLTQLLLRKVASLDINGSYSSSVIHVEKDGLC